MKISAGMKDGLQGGKKNREMVKSEFQNNLSKEKKRRE